MSQPQGPERGRAGPGPCLQLYSKKQVLYSCLGSTVELSFMVWVLISCPKGMRVGDLGELALAPVDCSIR